MSDTPDSLYSGQNNGLLCGEVARNALLRHTVEHRSLHRTPIKDDNILGGKDI